MGLMLLGLGHMTSGAAYSDGTQRFGQKGMMFAGKGGDVSAIFQVFWVATWILAIVLLIVLIRYFWKMGDKIK